MEALLRELHLNDGSQITLPHLLEMYLKVSRCWSNADLAVSEGMSVERALHILREVRDLATKHKQLRLAKKAHDMMWAIVNMQSEPPEHLAENLQHCGVAVEDMVDQLAVAAVATVH